jgi:hypothetical protein
LGREFPLVKNSKMGGGGMWEFWLYVRPFIFSLFFLKAVVFVII